MGNPRDGDFAAFDEFMSPQVVVGQLLKHHLQQVEKSSQRFLGKPEKLVAISTAWE